MGTPVQLLVDVDTKVLKGGYGLQANGVIEDSRLKCPISIRKEAIRFASV
jgi:hypothetical protein